MYIFIHKTSQTYIHSYTNYLVYIHISSYTDSSIHISFKNTDIFTHIYFHTQMHSNIYPFTHKLSQTYILSYTNYHIQISYHTEIPSYTDDWISIPIYTLLQKHYTVINHSETEQTTPVGSTQYWASSPSSSNHPKGINCPINQSLPQPCRCHVTVGWRSYAGQLPHHPAGRGVDEADRVSPPAPLQTGLGRNPTRWMWLEKIALIDITSCSSIFSQQCLTITRIIMWWVIGTAVIYVEHSRSITAIRKTYTPPF